MKTKRQEAILDLVAREPLTSQEQLRRRLRRDGIDATQATISRDITQLGLVKRAGDGAYQRPDEAGGTPESKWQALTYAAGEFLRRVDRVQQFLVLRTGAGQAQALAHALDGARLPESIGSIAGDDTVLVITKDARRAAALARRLEACADL